MHFLWKECANWFVTMKEIWHLFLNSLISECFHLIFIIFFPLPFSTVIPHLPRNHHTVVHVHKSLSFPLCLVPPPPSCPPPPVSSCSPSMSLSAFYILYCSTCMWTEKLGCLACWLIIVIIIEDSEGFIPLSESISWKIGHSFVFISSVASKQ